MLNKLKNQSGQSVLELMIAMSIFVLVVSGIMFLVLDAQLANRQGGERTKAAFLSQEAFEAVQSLANQGWRNLVDGDYGLDDISGLWAWSGNSNVFDQFTRRITVESVSRDGNGEVVESGGTMDFDTKKITIKTIWDFTTGRPSEVTMETLLTNWHSTKWKQNTQTEFNQGILNNVIATSTDDGEIVLDQSSVTSFFDSPFDIPATYTYNPVDIVISSSQASLVNQGASQNGGTINPSFDSTLTPWQYNNWDQNAGEVNVTGSRQISGGNPSGYGMVQVPRGRNDEVGGYFQQGFTVTENTPSNAYVQFDTRTLDFNGTPIVAQIYVFLDNAPGAPNVGTEIWTSGPLSGTSAWASIGPLDITSLVVTTGTYYLKLGFWVETDGSNAGQFQVGFDNATAYWEKITTPQYPTTKPTINQTTSFSSTEIDSWTGFQETATKKGGEIYYQLSDNDGTTWQFWNGSAWANVSGATDYNTASVINANISSFSATAKKLMFKAFLSSNGTQLVGLDNVRVTYDAIKTFDSNFDAPSAYTFIPADIEVASSQASLVNQGSAQTGGTTNPGFDTTLNPWSFSTWDRQVDEVLPIGSRQTSGGNPGARAQINLPRRSQDDEVGGYFIQSFQVTENNPTLGTVNFDWQITSYPSTPPTNLVVYAYLDSAAGAPVPGTHIWSSGNQTGATAWSNQVVDIISKITTSGTYYLKLAVWMESVARTSAIVDVSFDNAAAYWEKVATAQYPTTKPSITPITSFTPTEIDSWTGFQETATKNGGEIYYQLSDNDGTTWQFWNGSAWANVSGATDYNTAIVINSNISSFSVTAQKLMFKAFLSSNGTQLVSLDNVRASYFVAGGAGYFMSGDFESLAHDTGSDQTIYNYMNWNVDLPDLTNIQWQLRTADTSANLLSAAWVGSDGTTGSYYDTAGQLITTDPMASGVRWVQYKVYLSGDSIVTPTVYDITLDYEK